MTNQKKIIRQAKRLLKLFADNRKQMAVCSSVRIARIIVKGR